MEDALARLRRSCGAVTVVASVEWQREPLAVDFRILGPVEVRAQGRPLAVAGGRQRALLALLLLRAGEPVSRDSLIAGLWGERPPDGAVKTVHVEIRQIAVDVGDADAHRQAPLGRKLDQVTPGLDRR